MKFLFLILILLTPPVWAQSADEAFDQATEETEKESARDAQMREALKKAKKETSDEESESSDTSAAKNEEQLGLPPEEPEEDPGPLVKPDEAQATTEESPESAPEKEAPTAPKKKKRKKSASAGAVKTTVARKKIVIWQLGPRFMMWQEKVQAKESLSSYIYRARFTAVAVGVSHKMSMGSSKRWLYDLNGDLILGSVKASSTIAGQTDELQSQSFYGIQLSPGLVYRSNNNTMIGFSAPFFFRQVDWKLSRPALQIGDKTAYDFGLGINSQWRMRKDQFLKVGLTYRPSGALWTMAYDFTI